MLTLLRSTFRRLSHNILRTILVILSISLACAVITIAFSVRGSLDNVLAKEKNQGGTPVTIANAIVGDDGTAEFQQPPSFSNSDAELLQNEVPQLTNVIPLSSFGRQVIQYQGSSYRVRRSVGTGAGYEKVYNLEMLAGGGFDADAVTSKKGVAMISESLAKMIFGDAQGAVGKSFDLMFGDIRITTRGSGGNQVQQLPSTHIQIVGVFKDPDSFKVSAWNIADLVIPYTIMTPTGMNLPQFARTFAALLVGSSPEEATGKAAAVLRSSHSNEDLRVSIWEGGASGPSSVLKTARDALAQVSIILGGLGFLMLVISLFGVFSSLIVEVVDRRRDIGIRRAIGSSRGRTIVELVVQAMVLTGIGAVAGILLAAAFSGPVGGRIIQLVQELGFPEGLNALSVNPVAVLVTIVCALAAGAIAALIPGLQAARTDIISSIKDE